MIFVALYLFTLVKNESTACLKNPFVYEAQKLKKANNAEISCSCNLATTQFTPLLYFNSEKQWWGEYPQSYSNDIDGGFNISKYNITLNK